MKQKKTIRKIRSDTSGKPSASVGPYHHGNLRTALVEAAAALGAAEGVDAISLRRVAAAAHVSPAAPYHHFKDKADLLAAVADEGFRRLDRAMERAAGRVAPDDATERVRQMGVAYVTFATRYPHYFRVMFRPELARAAQPELDGYGRQSFMRIVTAVQEMLGERGEPSDTVMQRVLFAWSTVHGLASLWLDSAMSGDPPFKNWGIRRMTQMVTREAMTQMRVHGRDGDDSRG